MPGGLEAVHARAFLPIPRQSASGAEIRSSDSVIPREEGACIEYRIKVSIFAPIVGGLVAAEPHEARESLRIKKSNGKRVGV